jgi:hypothetical protein
VQAQILHLDDGTARDTTGVYDAQEHGLLSAGMRVYDEWFMNLPNGYRAIVDIRKLKAYCLNLRHRHDRNKARVFASVGIQESDAEELRTALLLADH